MNRFVCVLLLFSSIACASRWYPVTDHYDGKHFHNTGGDDKSAKGWWSVLKWKLGSDAKEWPDYVHDNVEPDFNLPLSKDRGAVTFINHATTFIQMPGMNVLTDPVFSERVSPFSWIGPKRHRDPGVPFAKLPPVHAVVISHNHYDHMDLASLKKIAERDHPAFFVPLGNAHYLKSVGIENVRELDWWETAELGKASITLVPTQHWSARGMFDRYEALWGGYVLRAGELKVFFAGDTGYNKHFDEVYWKFGAMHLVLLPIGAYEPRWFMQDQHMNPEEAVRATYDLRSRFAMAIHFGTFQLADEGIDDPARDLREALKKTGLMEDAFVIPRNGTSMSFY